VQNATRGMDRRQFLRRAGVGSIALASVPVLGHALAEPASAQADHVRWDLISVNPLPPGVGSVISAGGEADAFAYFTPGNPSNAKIRLTGSGTFVAPASGGPSGAVTGGGKWTTSGDTLPAGSGTYKVTHLVRWEFANFFGPSPLVDSIGDYAEAANGSVVLLIEYSDGDQGMLGVGCHGPGSLDGIGEGVIATKGYLTYWDLQLPAPLVDRNRTAFHVRQ